jgi:hypothetical protein
MLSHWLAPGEEFPRAFVENPEFPFLKFESTISWILSVNRTIRTRSTACWIAQAQVETLTIVTRDPNIKAYGVPTIDA